MAQTILVMGESGAGKTTSMRNLPPEQTLYIDCDGKGLQWRGWRDGYKKGVNYVATSDKQQIYDILEMLQYKKRPEIVKGSAGQIVKKYESPNATPIFEGIKYVVIDTLNGIMVDDEMARMKEKGYDKWVDLSTAVYGIIVYANKMRDDLTVIFTAHTQTERDENTGMSWTRMKTNGKKLDKIVLESKFSTVLLATTHNGEYVFETKANNSTAKTPLGAFDTDTIPNDIMAVITALEDYK